MCLRGKVWLTIIGISIAFWLSILLGISQFFQYADGAYIDSFLSVWNPLTNDGEALRLWCTFDIYYMPNQLSYIGINLVDGVEFELW